jgi:hypothetical protein
MGRDWYFDGEEVFDVPRHGVDFETGQFTKNQLLNKITALINSCKSENIQFATKLLQHFRYFLSESKDPNYYEYLYTCENEKYSFNKPVTETELHESVEQVSLSVRTFIPDFRESEWVDDSFKVIEKFVNGREPSSIPELEIEQFATEQYNLQLEEYNKYIENNTEKVTINYY